ncbi:MAG: hybrid sensor histidine kinase/response regulator [Verrucomicrobia bacterium]|nr:hybrid sensor histidine kinase/response regulator [Verrucomicrobiota bacterium]
MSTTTLPTKPPVNILIAEDSPTQAQRLRHILEQQGYQVTHAANGRLAFAAAQRTKPTLIISDVVMPEMDGYELCRSVKADAKLADLPVILVTTLSDPGDVIRGLECRADNFILKPYDERYLVDRVEYMLLNSQMRHAEQPSMGVEIFFNGQRHFITADRLQILNLLLSTYDAAIQRNKDLNRAQEELQRLNARLEMTNKELEAFSFSVSHDLRAPLRHIDGYASLLEKKMSGKLDVGEQGYLTKIVQSGRQMGQLIDDLLDFSRMGRAEMRSTTLDLNRIVQEVIRGLEPEIKGRQIVWEIQELPAVQADPALLRQVFVNLLGNAVKYTRGRETARIAVGWQDAPTENIVFVRDNGAGFNMDFAGKLFGVFQRLHRADEFEGTGIGLANVRRIITRHGGRTWAEGRLDEGAVFYFSLPKSA